MLVSYVWLNDNEETNTIYIQHEWNMIYMMVTAASEFPELKVEEE